MAVRYRPDEDEENNATSAMQNESAGMMRSGMMSSSGPTNTVQAPRQNTSGSFQNLTNFLNANKTQAVTMGDRVGGDIDKQVQQGNETIDKTSADYRTRVDQGTLKLDQGLVDRTIANPTGDTTAIRNLLSGKYKGPTNLQETDLYTPFSQKVGELQTTKELSNTSGGRNVLLGRTYGNPATAKYDQFLVTKTAPAWERITSSLNQIDPTVTKATSTVDQLAGLTPGAQEASMKAGQEAKTQLEGARNVIRDDVNAELQRRTASEAQAQDQLKQTVSQIDKDIALGNFSNVNLDDATLKQLGMTREQWDKYIGDAKTAYYRNSFASGAKNSTAEDLQNKNAYNLDSLLNITPGQLGTSDVATQQQKDRFTGLQQLLDDPSAFFTSGQKSVTNFDVNAFVTSIQNRLGESAAVGGDSLSDVQKQAGLAQGAKSNNANATALKGAASGAATGASIGSAFPGVGTAIGAVVGAVLGYVANGGIKASLSNGGFTGVTMDDARKNKDYIRQSVNPTAAAASYLGVSSNSTLGKALDPIPSTFSSSANDTRGTKDYKSYKNSKDPTAIAGRQMTADQIQGVGYHALGRYAGDPIGKALGKAFGIQAGSKSANHAQRDAISAFINTKLDEYMKSGKLPSDAASLKGIDGQKVFNNLLRNDLNAFMKSKGVDFQITSDAGTVERFLADLTDYNLYQRAK